MKSIKKVMAGLISAAILAFNMASLSANANEVYDYKQTPTTIPGQSFNITRPISTNFYGSYLTPPMIAGQTCKTPTVCITGSSNIIFNNDIGVWIEKGVGLNTNFVRSTSRTINIELYEEDENGTDILITRGTGYFTIDSDGVYTITNFSGGINTGGIVVEDDGIAEVYMKLTVSTVLGDKSVNIPAGLMIYRYWIN